MPTKLKINRSGEIVPDQARLEHYLFKRGFELVAGVDEAGRGPLAGPVVAAAVIIPPELKIDGIRDSKKLSPKKRDELFDKLINSEAITAVGIIDHSEIDRYNILKASLMAMRKAVCSLIKKPQFIMVDGNQTIPNLSIPQLPIVGGDALFCAISAASIIAKVTRDRIMDKYQELYPEYTFAKHRGYPTPKHLEELNQHGPSEIHRRTFRPVEQILNKTLFD